VINPATAASVLEEIVEDVEQVLVMTVNSGFGHQHFIHTTLPKIGRVRRMVDQLDRRCDVEVDGGIDAITAPLVIDAGANVLVAGSAIFNDVEDVAAAMKRLAPAGGRGVGVGIAADHGGFALKEELVAQLRAAGHEVVDFGAHSLRVDDDYPDFVVPLAEAVVAGNVDRGVAICGSGVGASVCANKIRGVRAAL